MSWGKALIREAQIYRHFVLFLILSGWRMTYLREGRWQTTRKNLIMRNKTEWKVMWGICLPFHYHFEIKECCSKIKAHTNVTIWKELMRSSSRYAPVKRFILFEIRARDGEVKELPGCSKEQCVSVLMFISWWSCSSKEDKYPAPAVCSQLSGFDLSFFFLKELKDIWRKKSGFSKFGINLLHSYLMRIKMFCL